MKKIFVFTVMLLAVGLASSFAQTTSGNQTTQDATITTDTFNGVEIDAYRSEPVVVEAEAPDSVELRKSTIPEDADHVEIMDSLQNRQNEKSNPPQNKAGKKKK